MYQIVAHKLRRSSSLDPTLSMVGMIDLVDGISDNSSRTAESVAREMCLSKAGRANYIGSIVDSSAQGTERAIYETSALSGKHFLSCRQCLRQHLPVRRESNIGSQWRSGP